MGELKKVRIGLDVDEITPYTAGDDTIVIDPTTKKVRVNTDVIPTRDDIPEGGGGVCMEEITWAALKAKRDAGTLDKGRQYRITDYVCTTTQEESRAVSHPFDVIVFADDESTLNENARACRRDGDVTTVTAYDGNFVAEEVSAQSICVAGIGNVFGTQPESITVTYDGVEYTLPFYTGAVTGYGYFDENGYVFTTAPIFIDVTIPGTAFAVTPLDSAGTHTLKIEYENAYYGSNNLEAWELKYCIDNDTGRFPWVDAANGKGVIYYMKDGNFNECPYDFKQIQFKRYPITISTYVPSLVGQYSAKTEESVEGFAIDEANPVWCYTFSAPNFSQQEIAFLDSSLRPISDYSATAYNIIRPCFDDGEGFRAALNNIVFVETTNPEPIQWGNKFGLNCQRNTFNGDASSNVFRSGCKYNIFEANVSNNVFRDGCSFNMFGTGCARNTFGDRCSSIFAKSDFSDNVFGNECTGTKFGNNCTGNTFATRCYSNVFGNLCAGNTFANNSRYNTFGNNCNYNAFGDGCEYIDFFTNGATGSHRYYHVMDGVAGTSSSHLAITGTGSNTYETYVGKNSNGVLKTWVPADLAP